MQKLVNKNQYFLLLQIVQIDMVIHLILHRQLKKNIFKYSFEIEIQTPYFDY